jgi:hypothetical protein
MTRGKYAARAAQGRAETAAARADRAKEELAAERAAHAAEVAALKARIEVLASQLTGEVKDLAEGEVQRVEAQWSALLEAERQRWRGQAVQVFDRIGRSVAYNARPGGTAVEGIPGRSVQPLILDLAQVLKIPAAEAAEHALTPAHIKLPRETRRAAESRIRAEVEGRPQQPKITYKG